MSITTGDGGGPGQLPKAPLDPNYAVALGIVPAPLLRRSLAFAVDAAVWCAFALVGFIAFLPFIAGLSSGAFTLDELGKQPGFSAALIAIFVSQALLTAYAVVQLILSGRIGRTLGKALFGLRVVHAASLGRPGFFRVLGRSALVWAPSLIVPIAGPLVFLLSPLWNKQGQGRGWHDRALGCLVLDVRTGLDPADSKALRLAYKAANGEVVAPAEELPSLASNASHLGHLAFLPGTRSSSGVIALHGSEAQPFDQKAATPAWKPPPVALPGAQSPNAPATPAKPEMPVAPAIPSTPTAAQQAESASGPRFERARAQRPPGPPPASVPPSAATLHFDDGAELVVTNVVLLGRNPQAEPGENVQELRRVLDPSMRISKTHLACGIDANGFWVEDRGSANGTTAIAPSGTPIKCSAGQRVTVPWGSDVHIGGRQFTVAAVTARSQKQKDVT